jgi:polyphosphate kinase
VKKSQAIAPAIAVPARGRRGAATAVQPAEAREVDLYDPTLYINRELALLAFQRRVLEEAEDPNNPLLERVKFLSILGSNLDEFFMIRVAGLLAQADAGSLEAGPDALSPAAQLIAIRREVKKLLAEAHRFFCTQLMPALNDAGIHILEYKDLDERQRTAANRFFDETVFPVLTPLALDQSRPFPHISNLSLNLAIQILDKEGHQRFARLKIPDSLPQLVPVNRIKRKHKHAPKLLELVWLEEIVAANLGSLFPGMKVVEAHPFHVTRDADIAIKELEAEDLLETIEEGVRQRRFGSVVRLNITPDIPAGLLDTLVNNLEIEPAQIFRVGRPLALKRLMDLYQIDRPELKDAPFVPAIPGDLIPNADDEDVFATIRRHDILLHHPFESFQPVTDLLKKAAHDPNVLAIKMVLYRVGRNAPVVEALLEAMGEAKQVAVLVELKARFDEESNIEWARALEEDGVHVVYGLLGLKIHCKVAMIVRREGDAIRRYVHLATGNYNAVTAHLYTDLGLFTADEEIADDVTDLFNYLTGYSAKSDYQKLLVAPVNLRERLEALIQREIEAHKATGDGHLIFKMNSLVDASMIRTLYRASQAGVKIQLLVRGTCCLRPGVPGVSDNIQVTSIVGRFLEHSRVFYFRNGGNEEIYLGSADLMPRNLNRRVEVLFPLEDAKIVRRMRDEILTIYLADTVKARCMQADGSYVRVATKNGKRPVNAQAYLLTRARRSQD